jgi:hypothetical protein
MAANFFFKDKSHNTELETQVLQEGMAQIVRSFRRSDNVVLSDESIWRMSSGSKDQLFPGLLAHSRQHGYVVKIIVYLRRQDTYLLSVWNQTVKQSTSRFRALTIDEHLEQILRDERYVVDYDQKLDEIAAFFGKENLIVRRYEPDSWYHGSIIDDFMQAIGLEVTDEYVPLTEKTNPGLTGNTIEIQRVINENADFTAKERAYLGHFLREIAPESGRRYPCSMLSQEETQTLLKKFEAGNAHVASTYIGDGRPLFSDEIKDLPKWQPDNPYMTGDLIRFFSAVSIDLHRENEELRREIRELRTQIKDDKADLRTFKYKLHHPFRTLWNLLFHRNQ